MLLVGVLVMLIVRIVLTGDPCNRRKATEGVGARALDETATPGEEP